MALCQQDLAAAQTDNAIRVALEAFSWLWILNVILGFLQGLAVILCTFLLCHSDITQLERKRSLRRAVSYTNVGMSVTTLSLNFGVVCAQREATGGLPGGLLPLSQEFGNPKCANLYIFNSRWILHATGGNNSHSDRELPH